jgi:hypothetical protein
VIGAHNIYQPPALLANGLPYFFFSNKSYLYDADKITRRLLAPFKGATSRIVICSVSDSESEKYNQ